MARLEVRPAAKTMRHPERSRFSGGARDLTKLAVARELEVRPAAMTGRHPERIRFSGGARDLASIGSVARETLGPLVNTRSKG